MSPTTRYVLTRTLSAVGTLAFVVVFNFFLFRVLPGDPVALYTRGRDVDPEQIRKLQAALAHGLTPIVCVGETGAERQAGADGGPGA